MLRPLHIINIIVLILNQGCNQSDRPVFEDITEYKNYYQNNNNVDLREQKSKDLSYFCEYMPHEVLILKRNSSISDIELKKELKKYNQNDWVIDYTIQLNTEGETEVLKYNTTNVSEYRQRIQQLNSTAENLFSLKINDKLTIPCKQVVFNRSYGLSDKLKLRLYFQVKQNTALKKVTCIFNDEVFGGGIIKNDITNQITGSPILKLTGNVKEDKK